MARSAAVEKAVSYIMAIPRVVEDMAPEKVDKRLKEAEDFEIIAMGYDREEDNSYLDVLYHGQYYHVGFFPEDFALSELFSINHAFTEEDIAIMETAKMGLMTTMVFGDDPQESYHLQIKILVAMMPNLAGIVDFGAERIISGVWADMTAISQVPPAPSYLYSLQAVSGDDDAVWIHTHGLDRCGLIELEVVGTNREQYGDHGTILNAMAMNAVVSGELPDEEEPIYVTSLYNGGILVATWRYWSEAINDYDADIVGGANGRNDGHCGESGLVFWYANQEDYENRRFGLLTDIDSDVYNNMLQMISNEETARMSALAKERIAFLIDAMDIEGAEAIVKMRLIVDEDKKEEAGSDYEHIWFSVDKIDEAYIWGELTQEPYFIDNLHPGSKAQLSVEDLTDWIIYLGEQRITPDSAYILIQR